MLILRGAAAMFAVTIPLACAWAEETPKEGNLAGKAPSGAKWPGFTISTETTYITEPLTADGYPDYFTAWERECSRGVTPENNAVVTLLRAFGPGIVPESQRDEFFGKLGVSPPPEKGKYFILRDEFIARWRKAKGKPTQRSPESKEPAASRETPADDEAATKAWLAEIDAALDVAVEASKRPRWYEPMLAGEEPSMLACAGIAFAYHDIPGYYSLDLTHGLLVRAAYRSEAGKHDDAMHDLLAAHRLARLIGQCRGNRCSYSAYAINAVACELDSAIATSGKVPRAQAEEYLKNLQEVGPPSILVQQLEDKRYTILDGMTRIRQNGTLVLASFAGEPRTQDPEWKELLAHASESDRPLKIANALIDLLIGAAHEPTYQQRVPKLQLVGFALTGLEMEWSYSYSPEEESSKGNKWSAKACERAAMAILKWGLQDQYLDESVAERGGMLYPPFVRESRAAARFELATTSWALALYRGEHGRYPETLADCCPRYLPQVPRDPFRDAPLVYRRDGDRFVLYSVGPNGQDDEGKDSRGQPDMLATDDIFLANLAHSEPDQPARSGKKTGRSSRAGRACEARRMRGMAKR